jgi:hypothetical protein
MTLSLPKCAVLTCTNEADPRWYATDVNGRAVMICDGHDPRPQPDEVTVCPPDPSAHELAERLVNGFSASREEVVHVARALLTEAARAKEQEAELAELRDLADLVRDADIISLPPELLAVRQRWIADRCAKEHAEAEAEIEAEIAEKWELIKRAGVLVARCRRCSFEAFPFADATIEDHMKACRPAVQR